MITVTTKHKAFHILHSLDFYRFLYLNFFYIIIIIIIIIISSVQRLGYGLDDRGSIPGRSNKGISSLHHSFHTVSETPPPPRPPFYIAILKRIGTCFRFLRFLVDRGQCRVAWPCLFRCILLLSVP
jgi:hypothetical protein